MKTKRERKQYRKQLKRQQEILRNPEITHLYIKKRGLYYKPNSCGYTSFRYDAGVFPKERYISEIMHDDLDVIVVDNDDHNQIVLDKIEHLKTRLIGEK